MPTKRTNRRDLTERNLPPIERLIAKVKWQGQRIRQLEGRIRAIENRHGIPSPEWSKQRLA